MFNLFSVYLCVLRASVVFLIIWSGRMPYAPTSCPYLNIVN
jgi:hypothetical protein